MKVDWSFSRQNILLYSMMMMILSSCIETVPIVPDLTQEDKIFIECELKAGQYGEAFVSKAEYVNKESNQTSKPDSNEVSIYINEMHKPWRVPFIYHSKSEAYLVSNHDLQILPGKFYAINGKLNQGSFELRGMIEVPPVFNYDSLQLTKVNTQQTGAKKWKTTGTLRVYYNRLALESDQYLHLEITDTEGSPLYFQPVQIAESFFRLSHRPGFLWKIDRRQNDEFIEVSFMAERDYKLTAIRLSIKNTSLSYYDYQKFKSNSPSVPNHSQNPAIAAFNMSSDAGFGSLMASSEEVLTLSLN